MPDEPRVRPVTEEDRERARQARAQLKRDLAEAAKRPGPPVTSPGKFSGWVGLDDQGNYLPPLTPEQKARKEAVRGRPRGQAQSAAARLAERLPGRELGRRAGRVRVAAGPATGSMYGLAYGDALGAPTEFLGIDEIVATYGPGGPRELAGDPAQVTDDTQMALAVGWALRDASHAGPEVLEPLLRQRFVAWSVSPDNDRAPGRTCLAACAGLARGAAWQDATVTGSKGCGANMRVAPVGLVPGYDLPTMAGVAQLQAGLTHGHPTALAASELTAYAVRLLREGTALADLPAQLRARCHDQRPVYWHDWLGDLWRKAGADGPDEFIAHGWDECLTVLDRLDAALARPDDGGDPCQLTGQGWIAEEALATGLLCAVRHADDPVGALARAATTSGDSDSIACLAGAFLGAAYGMGAWPPEWRGRIEYTDQLAELGAGWDAGSADRDAGSADQAAPS